jgi:hypothetical protein
MQIRPQKIKTENKACLGNAVHDCFVVAHLRNPFRRHKCGSLDITQASFRQLFDEFNFDFRRDQLWLVLQPITRTNLHDT